MQTNRHDEGDVNELAHTTRRVFCTDLLLSSAGLLLAATAATKDVAAQDSTVAYPARKIEGAEALLPGSSLYFNYPTRNDPAVCCALVRAKGVQPQMLSRGVFRWNSTSQSRCLMCPCHRGAYDARIGHVMFGPPERPWRKLSSRYVREDTFGPSPRTQETQK